MMANALDEWMSSKDEFLSLKLEMKKTESRAGIPEGETDETWRKKKDSESTQIERERGNVRENCKAKLTVVYDGFNFVVQTFIEEHTHPLATPSRVHLLRSHRGVSDTKIKLVKKFSNVNIPLYQQFELLETQAGGHESVGFIERDLRNFERDEREKIKGHDAEMLYEYFKSEEDKDSDFFFKFETDNNNRMTRCFWVDSVARKAYTHFGDVVVFDTTTIQIVMQ
ncbi:Far-red impaired responsive family protein, partial [Prunus dulcis]